MQRVIRKRVEIDECHDCKGMWLDATELASLVGTWNDLPRSGVAVSAPGDAPLCPRCNCPLEKRTYSEQRRILVDRCATCAGIWLDRGEFDGIVQMLYG